MEDSTSQFARPLWEKNIVAGNEAFRRFRKAGDHAAFVEAEKFLSAAVLEAEKCGKASEWLAGSLTNLALLLASNSKRVDTARHLLDRAFKTEKRLHGRNHIHVAVALRNVARNHEGEESIRFYAQALRIMERLPGLEESFIAETLEGLANAHMLKNDDVKAERLYTRALAIRQRASGAGEHVANTMLELARVYHHLREYKKAETTFERAEQMIDSIDTGFRDPFTSMHPVVTLLTWKTYYESHANPERLVWFRHHVDKATTLAEDTQ